MKHSPHKPQGPTPEFELACLCCRAEVGENDLASIAALLRRLDVRSFLELVIERHRIGPLVHAVLARLPARDLPAGLMPSLAEVARGNAVRYLGARRAHILLARWFDQAGIAWMPLKGLSLAERCYADPAQRHVNDLDVWVPAADLGRARQLLLSRGFCAEPGDGHWRMAQRGPRHLRFLMDYFHEERLVSADLGVLELHWRLTDTPDRFALGPQDMLTRASHVGRDGHRLGVLDDTDQLLYLCEHGGRHGWCRLKWLADLPRLLAQPWDWAQVLARARELRCERQLLLGCALCEALFAWAPDPAVRARLRRAGSLPLLAGLVQQTLQVPIGYHESGARVSLAWLVRDFTRSLLLSGSPAALATQVWRRALSPHDMLACPVPDRWFALYYLLRPLLFMKRRLRPG
ncbi:conserved hypothetical protein [Rubrivivax sp. A210]|uniref:nucleotidyltransferase domain-containing protein n=1 Tax=Rubrivivax sp. A210 TaxID=2772301 RepID=UPI0019191009|nr:nucleotidyltransferase family protein [Rubrivivax sp. A210]CAD5372617.1 conserved hypothetical protein [Rubrivivax sp. A210]